MLGKLSGLEPFRRACMVEYIHSAVLLRATWGLKAYFLQLDNVHKSSLPLPLPLFVNEYGPLMSSRQKN